MTPSEKKSEEDWQQELTEEQFQILRQKGTERAFTGKYWNTFEKGVYRCAGCGTPLFDSETKFKSGCGWPSFHSAMTEETIRTEIDRSFGMIRREALCRNCGGHLGHVFKDGPKPTGLRYCINSAALDLDQTE
ncbi:MAG: peptide-methionine (R)-S-oxide reductase MsrB [Candidatus Thorarchaeota archaeon]